MKILVVDNKRVDFQRFMELPFAKKHHNDIEYVDSPVGLTKIVDDNPDLRLIILDMLWEQDGPDEAKEFGADLIVIGNHGRNALGRALMGNTAEKVVRFAPCPVLVIRQQEHDFISESE